MSEVLLLEHLPRSPQGVLLLVYADGQVFVFPLNDEMKEKTYQNAVLVNSSPHLKRAAKGNASSNESKYYVYDTSLELAQRFKVATLSFSRDLGDKTVMEHPRKILLSPNKSLLLVLGAYHNDRKCLLVYQIVEALNENPFHLIFHDYDSKGIVGVMARHPHHLFVLQLPLVECPLNSELLTNVANGLFGSTMAKKNMEHHVHARDVGAFQPREVGPVKIAGPCMSVFGQPITISRISSCNDVAGHFQLVTLCEGALGEYCLWKIARKADGKWYHEICPRLVCPEVTDWKWLCQPDSPKIQVLQALFSETGNKLLLIVKREKFGKSSENGIGMQTCELGELGGTLGPWLQLTESGDPKDILCVKWSTPLLVGKEASAVVVGKKKMFFELVSNRYASTFQAANDSFKCTNFVQVGRFHRYWANAEGELRGLVVTPQVVSSHPEWADLFRKDVQTSLHEARVVARRVGYSVQDIQRDVGSSLLLAYTSRKGAKSTNKKQAGKSGQGENHLNTQEVVRGACDVLEGLHLFRCKKCLCVLMKPLLCGRCKEVCYCSTNCQASDWEEEHCMTCKPTVNVAASGPVTEAPATPSRTKD